MNYHDYKSRLAQQGGRLTEDIAACEQQIHALKNGIRQGIAATTSGLDPSFLLKQNEKTTKAHQRHLAELRRRQSRVVQALNQLSPLPTPPATTDYPSLLFRS